MTNPPLPTKAKAEFEGDCFGKYYLKTAPECQVCLVARRCRRAGKRNAVKEETMATKTKEKKAVKQPKEKKEETAEKARPLSKRYLKDKENCSLRVGSAGWAVYSVLREECGKKLTATELASKTTVFCKQAKKAGTHIKFNPDAKIPIMLRIFTKLGLIVYAGEGEYKKMI